MKKLLMLVISGLLFISVTMSATVSEVKPWDRPLHPTWTVTNCAVTFYYQGTAPYNKAGFEINVEVDQAISQAGYVHLMIYEYYYGYIWSTHSWGYRWKWVNYYVTIPANSTTGHYERDFQGQEDIMTSNYTYDGPYIY